MENHGSQEENGTVPGEEFQPAVGCAIHAAPSIDTPVLASQLQSPEPRSVRVSLEKFCGTGSWEDFLHQFRRAARVNRWSESHLVELLCLHLEGRALEFVNGLPTVTAQTFDRLVEALEGRFGTERMATVFKCELRQRKRKVGESLPDLGQDLRRLFRLAYPRATPQEQEEQLVDRFVEALSDRAQRLEVRRGRPATLEEAIHIAMDAEAWELDEEDSRKRARAASVESSGGPIISALAQLTQMINTMSQKLDSNSGPKKPVRCYGCGKKGNMKFQCPTAQGNEKQS